MLEDKTQQEEDIEEEEEEEEDTEESTQPKLSIAQQLAQRRLSPNINGSTPGFITGGNEEKEQKHPITGMFDALLEDEDDSIPLTETSILRLVMLSRVKPKQTKAVAQMLLMDRIANTDIHKRIIRYMLTTQIGEKGEGRKEFKEGLRDIKLPGKDDEDEIDSRL